MAARPLARNLMTMRERAHLVLAFAKTLYVNGQATELIVDSSVRLGRALGLRAAIMPSWGDIRLTADDEDGTSTFETGAAPTGVEMDRVASAMGAIEDIASGRLASDAAAGRIDEISRSPPSPTGLFALAAAAGAVALAVVFGVQHIPAAARVRAGSSANRSELTS
jgi:uncharacterized membrane protein YjjP (DUF1212 family)